VPHTHTIHQVTKNMCIDEILARVPESLRYASMEYITRESIYMVGSASALVTFIYILFTLRTQSSRSICNFTHYMNN
jgi:hypothetical protein